MRFRCFLIIASLFVAESIYAQDTQSLAKSQLDQQIRKASRMGLLPEGFRLCLQANMWNGEEKVQEKWEFTYDKVHRYDAVTEKGRVKYKLQESRPYDTSKLCQILVKGQALEFEDIDGEGDTVLFAGTHFEFGDRSVCLYLGKEQTHLMCEACVAPGYKETKAKKFASLYNQLAALAKDTMKRHK